MSDDLVISGGGSVGVATDEQRGAAARLGDVAREARNILTEVHALHGRVSRVAAHQEVSKHELLHDMVMHDAAANQAVHVRAAAMQVVAELDISMSLLRVVDYKADHLAAMLSLSALGYSEVEAVRERVLQELAAGSAYLAGVLSSAAFLLFAPIIPQLVAATPPKSKSSKNLLTTDAASSALTKPATVELIRGIVMSTDDYLGGTSLLPPSVVAAMGDEGLGLVGVGTSAAIIAGRAGQAGLLVETPVSVTKVGTEEVSGPPEGFAQRIDRLPNPLTAPDHAQIVVEKYSQDNQPDRYAVYIGGTVDFSPRAGKDAFDLTSNISGMAGEPSGSYVAVQKALADSGATRSSPVVFTGYSQGGLVASLLAASGDYNTQGVVTIGAPAGQVHLPSNVPAVIIEHTDDLVPALGGTQENHDAVLVRRQAFADRELPSGVTVPAHQLEFYRETGVLLDGALSPQVQTISAELNSFGRGSTAITSTRYMATRDL